MAKKKKEVIEEKIPTTDSILGVKKLADDNTALIRDCVDILKYHTKRLEAIELRLSRVSDRMGFDKEL